MRILLDECLSPRLRREFPGHDVRTVFQMGWRGKRNGDLLRSMSGQAIEVLITVDRNLAHQQNLRSHGVAVIVLIGRGNKIPDLIPLMPSTLDALATIRPGDAVEITS